MNETDEIRRSAAMAETCNVAADATPKQHASVPRNRVEPLYTYEIVRLATNSFAWYCGSYQCDHRIPISLSQIEAVPFLIVRHLMNDHGWMPEEVAEADPDLRYEVVNYCRAMGIEMPAWMQTGIPTKTG